MRKYTIAISLVGLTLSACEAKEFERMGQTTGGIVGGEPAPGGVYTWTAALIDANQGDNLLGQFCAGSLVEPRWIVTAAHCVNNSDPNDVDVGVGMHDLSANNGARIRAEQIIVHPEYNPATSENDIALVRLSEPANVTPIDLALPPVMNDLSEGDLLRVVGWGNMSASGSLFPNILQQVDVPFVSNADCNASNAYDGLITDTMLCAGDMANGGIDACQGDSGGPLMSFFNDSWHLSGVVSWGHGCAQPNRPGVYTRAGEFVNWVNQEISEQAACRATPVYSYWNPTLGDHLLSLAAFDTLWGWSFSFEVGKICQDQVAGTIPLHSYWNGNEGVGDHFYSRDYVPEGFWGWNYEYILGYIYQDEDNSLNTRPLCRMWNPDIFDHHYYAPEDGICTPALWGWVHERVEGYVLP